MTHLDSHDPTLEWPRCLVCSQAISAAFTSLADLPLGPRDAGRLIEVIRAEAEKAVAFGSGKLSAARGIVNGLLISLVLWALIIGAAVWAHATPLPHPEIKSPLRVDAGAPVCVILAGHRVCFRPGL